MDDVLKIAIGVFIGALAAAFTWEGVQTIRVEMALKRASDEMKRATTQAETQRRARQAENQAAQERQAREKEEREQQAAEEQRLQQRRKEDREAAFARFFQPTESCRNDPIQASCANTYMRAKTVFDSQYQPTR